MSENISLTLIAISTTIIALCILASTLVLYAIGRRLHRLALRLEQLAEQLRASAVPAAADLRETIRSISKLAAVGSRFARPMLASTVFRSTPGWVRSLGILAGLYAATQELLPSIRNVLRQRRNRQHADITINQQEVKRQQTSSGSG